MWKYFQIETEEKWMMLFIKSSVIHSGLFFLSASLFLITVQDSFSEKKD